MSPRRALATLAPLLLVLAGCGSGSDRPLNVVLVTLDTTRADFFSSYGHGRATTPHFDRLARGGALFEMCISSSAVTPVSHASILTGLWPYQHGLRVMSAPSGYRLPAEVWSLPEILGERGYRTGAFVSAYPVSGDFGLASGFGVFDAPELASLPSQAGGNEWDSRLQRRSDTTTERALEWLAGDGEEPFFLWVHYWDPHGGSALPPEDILGEWLGDLPPGAGELEQRKRLYAAQLHMIDRQFGRLVDHLSAAGHYEDTVFAIISDHGEGLGDHGWLGHRILYQEQIRLPLILRAPGLEEGRRVPQLVRSIDLFPTLLELLDVPAPGGVEGQSLLGLVRGEAEEPGRVAYAEQLNALDLNAKMVAQRPQAALLHVVMNDTWKLIWRPGLEQQGELYNLREDPGETRNLFESRPGMRRKLLEDLRARNCFRSEPFPATEDGSLPNAAALNALGY